MNLLKNPMLKQALMLIVVGIVVQLAVSRISRMAQPSVVKTRIT